MDITVVVGLWEYEHAKSVTSHRSNDVRYVNNYNATQEDNYDVIGESN